jgi:hypothetical protein
MSFVQKIRGIVGQQLLENTAGYRVIRGSGKSGPWIDQGESLALIPEGVQEVQFPLDVIASDSITAQVQVSVIFVYKVDASSYFNFAYSVETSSHTGNYIDAIKKAIINMIAPKIAVALRAFAIADMVKETTFQAVECDGLVIKSVLLVVKPRDAQVLAALGAQKTEELIRLANTARQTTREQAIEQSASLRTKEHDQALATAAEVSALITEQAKNTLAEAESTAAAKEKLDAQLAESAKQMVAAFNGDPMAYALTQLASSGGDVTVTTELLSALRGRK